MQSFFLTLGFFFLKPFSMYLFFVQSASQGEQDLLFRKPERSSEGGIIALFSIILPAFRCLAGLSTVRHGGGEALEHR